MNVNPNSLNRKSNFEITEEKTMKITRLFITAACVLIVLVATSFQPVHVDAATPTTGTFEFTFDITISSTIDTSTQIACGAILTVGGDTITPSITESQNANATRSSSTATCTVDIPYSWNLGNPTTDKISIVYAIEAPAYTNGTVPYRASQQRLADIAVPKTGTTTPETIAVTI
jgi:hypothetical protein